MRSIQLTFSNNQGRFSMVCRDAVTHKARAIGALSLSTDDERQLFAYGQGVHISRLQALHLTTFRVKVIRSGRRTSH